MGQLSIKNSFISTNLTYIILVKLLLGGNFMNSYKTKGTCSREILFDIKDNVIQRVEFIGGCAGNLIGIGSLVKGMKVDDAISKLKGIDCNGKGTSCPDQLAKALLQWKENNQS